MVAVPQLFALSLLISITADQPFLAVNADALSPLINEAFLMETDLGQAILKLRSGLKNGVRFRRVLEVHGTNLSGNSDNGETSSSSSISTEHMIKQREKPCDCRNEAILFIMDHYTEVQELLPLSMLAAFQKERCLIWPFPDPVDCEWNPSCDYDLATKAATELVEYSLHLIKQIQCMDCDGVHVNSVGSSYGDDGISVQGVGAVENGSTSSKDNVSTSTSTSITDKILDAKEGFTNAAIVEGSLRTRRQQLHHSAFSSQYQADKTRYDCCCDIEYMKEITTEATTSFFSTPLNTGATDYNSANMRSTFESVVAILKRIASTYAQRDYGFKMGRVPDFPLAEAMN